MAEPSSAESECLWLKRHAKYLRRSLEVLPEAFDPNRMSVAFFAISGFYLLPSELNPLAHDSEERLRCRRWIRTLYVYDAAAGWAGFHGSNALRIADGRVLRGEHHAGHVAMTYTALVCLQLLGDDLTGLDRPALARGVAACQQADGSFLSATEGGESDMRFTFCAAVICHLIGDWSGVDQAAATRFICRSISYEGAIAQGPHLEAHGGSTYCGLAALHLMGRMDALTPRKRRAMTRWCVNRLDDGFSGRPNKFDDTCYTFWLGASLTLLEPFPDVADFIRQSASFVLTTQDPITGGLGKCPDVGSDPLHTYLGLAGLGLANYPGLKRVEPAINAALTS
eukprot:snap_masked-scaffold119_size336447-processed-gene-1.5 protein:Tk11775 transcript:snap_masked-scaffold119_size336447-processed-gene-1.5-mRNA-1 annotation:"geranylgeranyl transferase type-1 subunit beta-like"